MSTLAALKSRLRFTRPDPVEAALHWARAVYAVGATMPSTVVAPTEETAGYLIPTLCAAGDPQFAVQLARWEVSRQRPDGAFVGADGVPYTFDTAQVVRGFLAVVDTDPEFTAPLRLACDYVERSIDADGRVHTESFAAWQCSDGTTISDYAHLYVLPPLLQAGRKLAEPRYTAAAERSLQYFKRQPDLVEFKPRLDTFSHIFGYMMEALAELGEHDLALKGLAAAAAIQRRDGAIPAHPGVRWVCSTGVAQLALAWYRLGRREPADRAVRYLETIQNPSGGFYGSYGKGASYFPDREIGWAVKYFLDCIHFQQNTKQYV